MSELQAIREGWDHAAREDAMFNIVTDPSKIHGGWTAEDFFAHGEIEVAAMLNHLTTAEIEYRRGRALDFGCGVGRLTQALARYFKRVDGVDLSPEMVDLARGHNKFPGRVEYHRNTERIPFRDGTFDLVYSRITLQHMPAHLQRHYVKEFARLLRPKGLAVFQIPEGPEYHHQNEWLSMYGVPRETVEGWVGEEGRLLDVELLGDSSEQWLAYRYTMGRR